MCAVESWTLNRVVDAIEDLTVLSDSMTAVALTAIANAGPLTVKFRRFEAAVEDDCRRICTEG